MWRPRDHLSSEWIAIQRDYLDRYIDEPFQLWGSLEGVDESFERYFDHIVPSLGGHAGKLNLMASIICDVAATDDVLIFLDGDAFPVADLVGPVRTHLSTSALTAVQRLENDGDCQPHPSFSATTAGFRRTLPGDWTAGHVFRPGRSDVGANLLQRLESRSTAWTPIHRTHSIDVHPVFFGVYGGFLYHHGAGFRRLKTAAGDLTPAGMAEHVELKPLDHMRGAALREKPGSRNGSRESSSGRCRTMRCPRRCTPRSSRIPGSSTVTCALG